MSKVVKGVGRVLTKVMKGTAKIIEKTVPFGKKIVAVAKKVHTKLRKNKIVRAVAIAAAIYFTGGAALGAIGTIGTSTTMASGAMAGLSSAWAGVAGAGSALMGTASAVSGGATGLAGAANALGAGWAGASTAGAALMGAGSGASAGAIGAAQAAAAGQAGAGFGAALSNAGGSLLGKAPAAYGPGVANPIGPNVAGVTAPTNGPTGAQAIERAAASTPGVTPNASATYGGSTAGGSTSTIQGGTSLLERAKGLGTDLMNNGGTASIINGAIKGVSSAYAQNQAEKAAKESEEEARRRYNDNYGRTSIWAQMLAANPQRYGYTPPVGG